MRLLVSGFDLYAGTSSSGVFRSADGGENWTQTGLTNSYIYSLAAIGTDLLAGVGRGCDRVCYGDGVRLSTDNGTTWTQTNSYLASRIVWCFAVQSANVFAGTDSGVFLSTNRGRSWTAVNSGLTKMEVRSLSISGANLFAGTFDAGVWRRPLSDMITSVDPVTGNLPQVFLIHQNYPNPFNPSTTIKYELPKASEVKLSIYDMLGREVSVLVNERRNAGVHEVKFDGAGLSSGVYFYRLQAGNSVQAKKLVILK